MRKLTYTLALALLAVVSCNKTEVSEYGGEQRVLTYEIKMPQTKSIGLGAYVNQVTCAVFDENGNEIPSLRKEFAMTAGVAAEKYQPSLYLGKNYTIVFWAQHTGDLADHTKDYYNVTDLKQIHANKILTNTDHADAFALRQDVILNANGSVTINGENATLIDGQLAAVLTRPMAQLNIGAPEASWNYDVKKSKIVLTSVYTKFNAVTGDVVDDSIIEGTNTIEVPVSALAEDTFTVEVDGTDVVYKSLSLNYIFPGTNAHAVLYIMDEAETLINEVAIDNIPVAGNTQTNVYGDLLKDNLTYSISLSTGFTTPDKEKEYK